MNEERPEAEPIKIANLILVVVLLILFHFGLTVLVVKAKVHADSILEISRVEQAISGYGRDPGEPHEAEYESRKQGGFETLVNLPIIYFTDRNPKGNWAHSLEIPLSARLMNSIAAAMILQMLGMLAVQLLPEAHRWRRFLEGRGIHARGGIPKEFDRVPIFKVARKLEKVERTVFGKAMVIAFFHFFFSQAVTMVYMGTQIAEGGPAWAEPLFRITHFPVSPLVVPYSSWLNALSQQAAIVLTVVNALVFGLAAQAVIEAISRRRKQ